MNTRRKRNTTRDSKEAEVRSSLSESLEAIRPQSKRQPTRGTWVTPKGQDGIDVFAALEGLPDSLVDDGADLFASLGGSLGSLGGSLNLSLKLPTPREAPTAVAFPITVDNGGHTGAAAEDDDEGMGQFSTEPWGEEEDAVLREAVLKYGRSDWRGVSRHMLPAHVHRSPLACERRWQVVKENVVKGPWLPEEDQLLRELVAQIGAKKMVRDCSRDPRARGQTVPGAVAEPLGQCREEERLVSARGRHAAGVPKACREPLVRDRQTPARPRRERGEEPLQQLDHQTHRAAHGGPSVAHGQGLGTAAHGGPTAVPTAAAAAGRCEAAFVARGRTGGGGQRGRRRLRRGGGVKGPSGEDQLPKVARGGGRAAFEPSGDFRTRGVFEQTQAKVEQAL
mmetsp:Transcript_68236/g.127921  ORF Transcript_68236/g.127921 Transcript_68236/m.127921 type:complete len:394 (-) Transcript_68236:59-1240(-)